MATEKKKIKLNKCEHETLTREVSFAFEGDTGSIICDIWCKDCRMSGSVSIDPSDVEWDD